MVNTNDISTPEGIDVLTDQMKKFLQREETPITVFWGTSLEMGKLELVDSAEARREKRKIELEEFVEQFKERHEEKILPQKCPKCGEEIGLDVKPLYCSKCGWKPHKDNDSAIDFEKVDELYRNIKKFACKYCMFENKSMIMGQTMFESRDALLDHIEMEHDLVMIRPGETEQQAWDRVRGKNSRINTSNCQCPLCKYHIDDGKITEIMISDGRIVLKNSTTYIAEIDEPMNDFGPMLPGRKCNGKKTI